MKGSVQVAKKSKAQPFPPWGKHQAAAKQIPQPAAPARPDDSKVKGGLADEQHRARGRTKTAYAFNKVGVKRRSRRNDRAAEARNIEVSTDNLH
jgi:hypothetical protein